MTSTTPATLATDDTIYTKFNIDDTLTALFKDCTDNHGQGESTAEWGNNLLSSHLVVYGDGMISKRNSDPPTHRVSSNELQLCKMVSQQLAARCTQEVGMGSEGSSLFSAFYMVAQISQDIPPKITPGLIRSKFADTIFPLATITVEPLETDCTWWEAVYTDGEGESDYLVPWHDMIKAFREHPDLHSPVFVQIGNYDLLHDLDNDKFPPGTELTGSCMPRMPLALTKAGSIVGLFGDVIQT